MLMQKKSLNPESLRSLLLQDIKSSSRSFSPIIRNGWAIKFSLYLDVNILLVFMSMHTAQTIIKYYDNENDAIKYINYVISKDAQETIEA